MPGWDSYRAVYGAELRAAAREFDDHGWPVVEETASTILLVTGTALDVLEMPTALGHRLCATLRNSGSAVPVAATPTGTWWFPISAGATLPAELQAAPGVVLHAAGDGVLAPPSVMPDGWVHWRVAPALCGYQLPPADMIFRTAVEAVRISADPDMRPGAQRPAGAVVVGMRS